MTLRLTESFDANGTASYSSDSTTFLTGYLTKKHSRQLTGQSAPVGGGASAAFSNGGGRETGRHGAGCVFQGGSNGTKSSSLFCVLDDGVLPTEIVWGFAVKVAAAGNFASAHYFLFREYFATNNSVDHLRLYFRNDGSGIVDITSMAGTGNLSTLGSFTLPLNQWAYLEIKVRCHDSVGAITVRLNGIIVLSLTAVRTKNSGGGGNGFLNCVGFVAGTGGTGLFSMVVDDMYVLDTTGPAPCNDFLGDVTIEYLQPTADGTVAWTPSAGANWDAVADPATSATPQLTDYVSSGTDDQQDLYALADSAATTPNTVLGVMTYAHAEKSDSGARTLALVQELSGSVVQSADLPLLYSGNGGPLYLRFARELAPDATAWSLSDLNALKIGLKARP